jgi:ribosomal protein S12 methylthiotransferase
MRRHSTQTPVVALVSLGCSKNLVDSERMLAMLAEAGCVVGADLDEADVVVINTCGFLHAARTEALDVIGQATDLKEAGKLRRVVVAGCLAQRDGERLYDVAPGIDAVIGVNDRDAIVRAVTSSEPVTCLTAHAPPGSARAASDAGRFRLTVPHCAYLRIAEGCSSGCSFCTIPAIRGPFRSKTPDDVLAEAGELVADGAVELNVIAQNTTAYGRDLDGQADLAGLLARLDADDSLGGLRWIRLLYTHPDGFTPALMDLLGAGRRVLPYVDIPLQHISPAVLERMGRGGDADRIEALLDQLRARVPGLSLRTTLIVGFPGESEEDFDRLLEFVRRRRFEALGVFEYSPEEGTPAASMEGQVDEATRRDRAEAIMIAQQEIAFERAAGLVGERVEVLVDGLDETGVTVGRHAGQAPDVDSVCLLTDPVEPGTMLPCKVVASEHYDLIVSPA